MVSGDGVFVFCITIEEPSDLQGKPVHICQLCVKGLITEIFNGQFILSSGFFKG